MGAGAAAIAHERRRPRCSPRPCRSRLPEVARPCLAASAGTNSPPPLGHQTKLADSRGILLIAYEPRLGGSGWISHTPTAHLHRPPHRLHLNLLPYIHAPYTQASTRGMVNEHMGPASARAGGNSCGRVDIATSSRRPAAGALAGSSVRVSGVRERDRLSWWSCSTNKLAQLLRVLGHGLHAAPCTTKCPHQ
jgi:hypothetical protein